MPLPRVHLVRSAGRLAPLSTLREAMIPTPRQQGVDGEEATTGTPSWSWARLLGRVCALDMTTCLPPLCGRREPCDLPFCRQGALRIIAAITQAEVIRKLLRHLKRAAQCSASGHGSMPPTSNCSATVFAPQERPLR